MSRTTIIDVTDAMGKVLEPSWLVRAESVHRELRQRLPSDYLAKMHRVFDGGGRMCVAVQRDAVVGIGVFRIYENTFDGRMMYVDDLITTESERSAGVGKALMEHMQGVAREASCASYTLDSGTQRVRAHKFYLREGMAITGFHFEKPVS